MKYVIDTHLALYIVANISKGQTFNIV